MDTRTFEKNHSWSWTHGLTHFKNTSRGFTLLEVLLVVGVLVAVAAVAIPNVTRSFSNQSLIKGADRVRVAMGRARVKAIRTGKIHVLSYVPGSGWLDVAALDQLTVIASLANRRMQDRAAGLTSDYDADQLPNRIAFVAGQTVDDARSLDTLSRSANANQLKTILFYPDGTSQDAQLTLQNETGQMIDVKLRGLTGTASVLHRDARRQQ